MITIARFTTLGLILFNVFLVSFAQLLLKIGSGKVYVLVNKEQIFISIFKIAFNPYIFWGTSCYVVSLILWIYILTRASLSIAYPMMSLSYVVVMFFSILFIKEHITFYQWIGVSLVVVGTSMIFIFK